MLSQKRREHYMRKHLQQQQIARRSLRNNNGNSHNNNNRLFCGSVNEINSSCVHSLRLGVEGQFRFSMEFCQLSRFFYVARQYVFELSVCYAYRAC